MRYAVVSIALLMTTLSPAVAASTYISGRVVTEGTDAGPVAAAAVALRTADKPDPVTVTQTLTNGSFILKAPAPGDYRLSVTAANCLPLDRDLTVPAGGIVSLELVAHRLPTLRLRLVGPDGSPVTHGYVEAQVSLTRGSYQMPLPPITGPAPADGVLEISVPMQIRTDLIQELTVAVRDAQIGCGQRSLGAWPDAPVMLPLARGSTLHAVVRNRGGDPAPGATLLLFRVGERGVRPAGGAARGVSGADGVCEIKALFPGRYVARVLIPGERSWTQPIIIAGPTTDLELAPSNGGAPRRYR